MQEEAKIEADANQQVIEQDTQLKALQVKLNWLEEIRLNGRVAQPGQDVEDSVHLQSVASQELKIGSHEADLKLGGSINEQLIEEEDKALVGNDEANVEDNDAQV